MSLEEEVIELVTRKTGKSKASSQKWAQFEKSAAFDSSQLF
jgi:hypothetical protein